MATGFINLLSQSPSASGLNLTNFRYIHSFDQISPTVYVQHRFQNPSGLNNIGDVGTDFTFSFYGNTERMYVSSKEVNLDGEGNYSVSVDFLGRATKNTLRTPKKPWKFMTMTANEIEIFLKYTGTPGLTGTAQEFLEFIPFIKKGDEFYDNGWKAKEIARFLCTYVGLGLRTNIPDFYIKEISVEGSYFNAVLEIFGRYSPKYFVENNTLYILSYGGTNQTVSTGMLVVRDINSVSYRESYIDSPRALKVYGGDGAFVLDNYVGKKSSVTVLTKYTDVEFGTGFFAAPPDITYYSYGLPYIFNEVSTNIGVLSADNFPDLDELVNLTKRFRSADDLRTENRAEFVTETIQYHHRTVFDEPGDIFFKSTKTKITKVDQIGQLWGADLVVNETFEYTFFGRTVDYVVDTPILSSYSESELASLDLQLNLPFEYSEIDYSTEKFNPVRITLECTLLPSKISNDLKASTTKKLMPKKITYEYRIHSRKTGDQYLEGDLILEMEISYEVCVVSSDGIRKRIRENTAQVDFRGSDVVLPFAWNFYNPAAASIAHLTVSECLVDKREVRYYRHGEKIHRKVTVTSSLNDDTGRVETNTYDETVQGEMPNERLMPRKLPMLFGIEWTSTSLDYWNTPVYELRDANIINYYDIRRIARHLAKTVVRPNYTIDLNYSFPLFVDIGSKIVFLNNQIRNALGTIQVLDKKAKCVVSNVSIEATPINATATTQLGVDVYY